MPTHLTPPAHKSTYPVLLHQNPPSKEDSLANASSGARQEDVTPLRHTERPQTVRILPTNVIPAKADTSGATDEVNPGSTTFRTNYPLAWARPSSTTCPPWQYRAHSRFHVLPEQNPPSKGDSLATASSGARQGDVTPQRNTRYPEALPIHRRTSMKSGSWRGVTGSMSYILNQEWPVGLIDDVGLPQNPFRIQNPQPGMRG